jgi:glyoxylase-like metal-dependent hydrolase (beta-lactamase superfamily II)
MTAVDRRAFLGTTVGAALGCGAHVLAALAGATTGTRQLFAAEPRGVPVRREPWGRLERVADGVWMLISTPLAADHAIAMRTFSNGGLVAGRDGVLAVEGFASEEGAGWLAGEARRLTGRWPSHVVLTHCHGDHSAGLGGYGGGGTRVEILPRRSRAICSANGGRRRFSPPRSFPRSARPSSTWAGAGCGSIRARVTRRAT